MKSRSFVVTWEQEHFFASVSRNKVASLFKGIKSFEMYYGLDITCSDINVSFQPMELDSNGTVRSSNGINFPVLNVPADPVVLRELAKSLEDCAKHIEGIGDNTT